MKSLCSKAKPIPLLFLSVFLLGAFYSTALFAADEAEFKKTVKQTVEAVAEGKSQEPAKELTKVLQDLYTTEHARTFDRNFRALRSANSVALTELSKKAMAAKSKDEYTKYKNREAQLKEFWKKAEMVEEDYVKGAIQSVIMGAQGTGKLPYAVEKTSWSGPEKAIQESEYANAYKKAKKVVEDALDAVASKDEKKFVGKWVKKQQLLFEAEPEESKVRREFKSKRKVIEDKKRSIDVMPEFLLSEVNFSTAEKIFDEKGKVKVFLRDWRDGEIKSRPSTVWLEKEGGNYRISKW